MAIKALMLRKKLDGKKAELEALRAKEQEFAKREAELEKAVSEANTDEERTAVEAEVETFTKEQTENAAAAEGLQREVEGLEAELAAEEAKQEAPAAEARKDKRTMETRDMETREKEIAARKEREAYSDYIRRAAGVSIQHRDDPYNMTQGNNGGVVPKTISDMIITKVEQISPIYKMAHHYPVAGTLEIPYYPASSDHVIAAGYKDEMADLVASSGDLGTVELTGFLAGALAKISKKLVNNTNIDLVPFNVDQMAVAFKRFFEHECLVGTTNKCTGILAGVPAANQLTMTYKSIVTADNLIDLQLAVPGELQENCRWCMKLDTFKQVRKLKDGEGNYLLTHDFRNGFGYMLLGKPVDISSNMPAMGTTGNKAIFYGDYYGLAVKQAEELEIEVLKEAFAAQHAIGVIGWTEIDTKVENEQMVACLKCGSSDPQ